MCEWKNLHITESNVSCRNNLFVFIVFLQTVYLAGISNEISPESHNSATELPVPGNARFSPYAGTMSFAHICSSPPNSGMLRRSNSPYDGQFQSPHAIPPAPQRPATRASYSQCIQSMSSHSMSRSDGASWVHWRILLPLTDFAGTNHQRYPTHNLPDHHSMFSLFQEWPGSSAFDMTSWEASYSLPTYTSILASYTITPSYSYW